MNKDSHKGRVAFLLNANAKSVTKKLRDRFLKLIPKDDIYFSHSFADAEKIVREIIKKEYAYLFSGGGDGTATLTINLVAEYKKTFPHLAVPRIGLLKLGTGNALARLVGAQEPEQDIQDLLSGKALKPMEISMVETRTGQLTPFAGIGFDGELMNDFESVKEVFFESPFRKFFTSFLGYTIAGAFKTLPRHAVNPPPKVHVKSAQAAYRIVDKKGVDEEIYIEPGQDLFKGAAPLICVGTVPSLGYGLTMFPFANKRPGYMHLRIVAVPISVCVSNLYPAIWYGYFRHPKLYDFLVKDVTIESKKSLPYQIAGDAMGYEKKLFFKTSAQPISMAALRRGQKNVSLPTDGLLTPLI